MKTIKAIKNTVNVIGTLPQTLFTSAGAGGLAATTAIGFGLAGAATPAFWVVAVATAYMGLNRSYVVDQKDQGQFAEEILQTSKNLLVDTTGKVYDTLRGVENMPIIDRQLDRLNKEVNLAKKQKTKTAEFHAINMSEAAVKLQEKQHAARQLIQKKIQLQAEIQAM